MNSSRCGNVAAILQLDEGLNKQFQVFEAAPHVCIENILLFLKNCCYFDLLLTCIHSYAGIKRDSFQKATSRLLPLRASLRPLLLPLFEVAANSSDFFPHAEVGLLLSGPCCNVHVEVPIAEGQVRTVVVANMYTTIQTFFALPTQNVEGINGNSLGRCQTNSAIYRLWESLSFDTYNA